MSRWNRNVNPRKPRRKGGACKSAWRTVAESYPCETCGAAPTRSCITIGGREAQTPHTERTNLAAANFWRPADYQPSEPIQ